MAKTLKIIFKSGYEYKVRCSDYSTKETSSGELKSIMVEPVDSSEPKIIYIDISEVALITISR